ncbi:MAG: hypothetical protein RBR71_03660 [Gudongella sp.]|nr:hypothetical protein [Gudongella sp.]
MEPNYIYFTFGSRGQVFGGGYIKIKADLVVEAQEKFIKRYGAKAWKHEGILSYAFHYTEKDFMQTDMQYGVCHEVIQ